jgi:16S rRNA (guanine527-N7)-methyltransferase
MPLPDMLKIVRKNISRNQHNAMANGIICLKGGSLDNEMSQFRNIAEIQDISLWFEEDWFKEKQVVYVPV